MASKSAADNMPLDEATEFLVRAHRKLFNQNPSKVSLIRHIKRLDKELQSARSQSPDHIADSSKMVASEREASAQAVEVGEWVSVDERQPDEFGEYLAATVARPHGWVIRYAPVGWICSEDYPVTHWMPLPQPPKSKEGES